MSELRESKPSIDDAHGKSVFFSYSVKDSDFISTLERALERSGHVVWDERKLRPGQDWVAEIDHAIEQCDVAVVVITPNYVQSSINSYEAGILLNRAKHESLKVIPIVAGAVQNEHVPFQFQKFSVLDGRQSTTDQLIAELISALKKV